MNTFIGQYYLQNLPICDELIEFHKNSSNKILGLSSEGINKEIKDSTDVRIEIQTALSDDTLQKYLLELTECAKKYSEQYKWCNEYAPWSIIEHIGIQHYAPKQGYHAWHTERGSNKELTNTRHLAFMTYLNDVNDGGETEFYYQDVKIKPQKGLTLIWPVDWTHTHRGITSPTEEKYIITGWYNFINSN